MIGYPLCTIPSTSQGGHSISWIQPILFATSILKLYPYTHIYYCWDDPNLRTIVIWPQHEGLLGYHSTSAKIFFLEDQKTEILGTTQLSYWNQPERILPLAQLHQWPVLSTSWVLTFFLMGWEGNYEVPNGQVYLLPWNKQHAKALITTSDLSLDPAIIGQNVERVISHFLATKPLMQAILHTSLLWCLP